MAFLVTLGHIYLIIEQSQSHNQERKNLIILTQPSPRGLGFSQLCPHWLNRIK